MNQPVLNTKCLPFDYVVEVTLTTGQQLQTSLTLQADSYFELVAILGTSSKDGATDIAPNNFSVQMTDQSSGRQFSNVRVPQRCLAGTARYYRDKWRKVVFPPRAVILFDFLDLSSDANSVKLVLTGYKDFDVNKWNRQAQN